MFTLVLLQPIKPTLGFLSITQSFLAFLSKFGVVIKTALTGILGLNCNLQSSLPYKRNQKSNLEVLSLYKRQFKTNSTPNVVAPKVTDIFMTNYISKWAGQFLCHIAIILKNNLLSENKQMGLNQCFQTTSSIATTCRLLIS